MATRNLEAIEHRGKVYVSLEDLQTYLASLVPQAANATGKDALHHVLYQLAVLRSNQPV